MDTAFLYFEVKGISYGNNKSQKTIEKHDEIRLSKLKNYKKFHNGDKNRKG